MNQSRKRLFVSIIIIVAIIIVTLALINYLPIVKCKAQGGTIIHGFARYCAFPTSDTGQPCTDSDQCENKCVYNEKTKSGECYQWNVLIGCHTLVEEDAAKQGLQYGGCGD